MSPITTAVMSTAPVARAGMASATSNTMRQLGGVFGVAVLGSIVTTGFSSALASSFAALGLPPSVAEKAAEMAQEGRGMESVPSLPGLDVAAIQRAVNDSFMVGLHRAVWIAGLVLFAGAIASALMIRGTSPQAQLARRAAEAAAAEAVVTEAVVTEAVVTKPAGPG